MLLTVSMFLCQPGPHFGVTIRRCCKRRSKNVALIDLSDMTGQVHLVGSFFNNAIQNREARMGSSNSGGGGIWAVVLAILAAMLLIGFVMGEWWGWSFALLGILVGLLAAFLHQIAGLAVGRANRKRFSARPVAVRWLRAGFLLLGSRGGRGSGVSKFTPFPLGNGLSMESSPMVRSASRRQPVPEWHKGLLKLLPRIALYARVAFRQLDREARAEAVQNCIANATIAYARLFELGKVELAYAAVLARYAVAQTREGRIVGTRMNVRDISSSYAQAKKGIAVERLDHYDKVEDCWQELILEDRHASPAEIVATKLDFAAWLRSLPIRQRRIAKVLATGETTLATAHKFGVTESRISQVRRELADSWRAFLGEPPLPDNVAAAA